MATSARRAVLAFAGAALVAGSFGWAARLHAKPKRRVHAVRIEGMKFVPEQIEVWAGDTIVLDEFRRPSKTIGSKKS